MRIRPLGLVAITVALVGIAIAAVAFGPADLAKLGSPSGPKTPQTPQATSINAPTWHVGDSWTYNVNSTPPDVFVADPTWGSPSLTGTLTRTVVSADNSDYTVTMRSAFPLAAVIAA